MSLSQTLQDYAEANDYGKQDMFEEAAERMIAAEIKNEAQARRIEELEAALNDAVVIVDYYRTYEFNSKVNNPAIFTDTGYYNLGNFLNAAYALLAKGGTL